MIKNTPGRTNPVVYSIETSSPPTKLPPYRLSEGVIGRDAESVNYGVNEHFNSLINKKDGSL